MIQAVLLAAVLCLLSTLALTGCATKNDAGIVLHRKPDLTTVAPGTPVSKVASLKKPIKREVITKGELKGAEAWLYEWDAPGDEVNNKMFTSVVVKDGVILGYAEDTPDKWRKDPKLHEAAKLASSWEDIRGHMAQAARWQAAADALAGYNANRSTYNPMQFVNASTFNYTPTPYQPIPFGDFGSSQQPTSFASSTPAKVYPTIPGSLGMRDVSRLEPTGVVQGNKVYPTIPGSLGMRDVSRLEPVGVVQGGKVYPTIPGSGGMRDITKMEPTGVVGR